MELKNFLLNPNMVDGRKAKHPLFDDVGMSFGRPEIMSPINKSSQGLQFRVHVLRAVSCCSSPQKLKEHFICIYADGR